MSDLLPNLRSRRLAAFQGQARSFRENEMGVCRNLCLRDLYLRFLVRPLLHPFI